MLKFLLKRVLLLLPGIAVATGDAASQARIENFAPDDPEMSAAIATARAGLPGFFQRFHAGEGERFSVKLAVPIKGTPDYEHIWMRIATIDDGKMVRGHLTNDPENLPGLRFGSAFSAPLSRISDWSYWKGGMQFGNYTTRVILKRLSPAEAEELGAHLSPWP